MQTDYFSHSRQEIAPLLPPSAIRVLEIGCSAGGTMAWLKAKWPDAEFVGVDGNPNVLGKLRSLGEKSFIHDLENPLPEIGQFDLILALDILEHLRQPALVLKDLVDRLTHSGRIIVSLPNVAHASVIVDLALRRQFEYRDAGILDRTHLRFFTEKSALALMKEAGLSVVDGVANGLDGSKAALANALTGGLLFHYLVKQYIMAGVAGQKDVPFKWQIASETVDT